MTPHTLIAEPQVETLLTLVDELWVDFTSSMVKPLCLYLVFGNFPLSSNILKLSLEGIPVSDVLNSL